MKMSIAFISQVDKVDKNNNIPPARTIVITMVLAFVIPVIIMSMALLKIQVWPGGKYTLYIYDMSSQFAPVITSLRYLGKSDSSLLLSFYGALGNNAYLNYYSFVLDPTMWITLLFPLESTPDVIYFITLFKIGMCGVTSSVFFCFGNKNKKYPVAILVLSICYALMSYNIMFSQIVLFYNVIALVPIILLGVEHMIEGKKGGVYILCMTLSLYYSIQLSYMTGVFVVLYLIWRLSDISKDRIRIMGRFVISNILCVGLYVPAFLPLAFNIAEGRMQTENYRAGTLFYYSFRSIIRQFLSCQYDTLESGGLPLIFCGTFIPLLAVLAVVLPIDSIKSRVVSACIITFFVVSFWMVPLNQFWHGFNEPNSFPVRYSFLFCLYMLILVYRVFCYTIERVRITKVTKYALYGVALSIACIEMYLNAGYILASLNLEMGYGIRALYQREIQYVNDAIDKIDDNDFYRIGRDLPYGFNDGMLFGYNGIGYFSSMFERVTMSFIGQLGYSQYEHAVMDAGGTPLAESLLGVRYKIVSMPKLFGYYESIYNNSFFELQYNNDALPLGFLINYQELDPNDNEDLMVGITDHNSFAFQEYTLSEFYGQRIKAFEKINYSIEDVKTDDYARYIKMRFTATDDKPVWIYCKDEHDGSRVTASKRKDLMRLADGDGSTFNSEEKKDVGSMLKVNGENKYPFVSKISTMCIYLGTFEPGEEVEVEAACVNPFEDPWIVYYNEDECNGAFSAIRKRGFEVTEHKNGVIKGKINIEDDDDLMIMTLPYMKGYQVKVDGVKTEYGSYRNALFALKMNPGEHEVEISFIPHGLIPGGVIGIIFLAITVLYLRGVSFVKHRFADTE